MRKLEYLVQDLTQGLSVVRKLIEDVILARPVEVDEVWIDGKQVMQVLKISQRTLQTLRSTGKLPFSSVNQKFYYKVSDIHQLLDSNYRSKVEGQK